MFPGYAPSTNAGTIVLMLRMIDQVLDEVTLQVSKAKADSSEYIKRLLSVMEYDVPYTAKDILEKLGLRSRETLRKNYLWPAIAQGLVRMTLPDTPNSRNQRYVRI